MHTYTFVDKISQFCSLFKSLNLSNVNIGSSLLKIFEFYVVLIWFQELYLYTEFNLGVHFKALMWLLPISAAVFLFYLFRSSYKSYTLQRLNNFWVTFLCLLFIFVVLMSHGVFKDTAYDTFNYHLIDQEPQFKNFFTQSLGEGNFQVWGFRLGDRLFYLFRHYLGFRLGTSLNIICCFIFFYQLRDWLIRFADKSEVLGSFSKNNKDAFISIAALALVIQIHVINQSASYYVDIVALPLCLKAIDIVIFGKKVSQWYLFFLLGIILAFKLTNIVYVLPICLLVVFKNLMKDRSFVSFLKVSIFGAVLVLIPASVYLAFNYQCTDNPLFPYYNGIFKSEYFPIFNFKDLRWGGQNAFEKFLWIFYAAFNPFYRIGECTELYDFILIGGVVSLLIFALSKIKSLKLYKITTCETALNKSLYSLIFIMAISSVLWGFSTGISRYYMLGTTLFAFFLYIFSLQIKVKKLVTRHLLVLIVMLISVINVYRIVSWGLATNYNWSMITFNNVRDEIAQIVKVKKIIDVDDSDLHIAADYRSNGFSYLANKDVPKVYIEYIKGSYPQGKARLDKYVEQSKRISLIHENNFYDLNEVNTANMLNDFNFYITGVDDLITEYGENSRFSLKPNSTLKNEIVKFKIQTYESEIATIPVHDIKQDGDNYFKAIICRKFNMRNSTPFALSIYCDKVDEKYQIYSERFYEYNPREISVMIPDHLKTTKNMILKIDYLKNQFFHINFSLVISDYLFLINPRVETR